MAKKTFIGNAFISITGNKKGLDAVLSVIRKDMQKFGRELQQMGYKFLAAGAAIQAPLTLAVQQFARMGDEVAKAAKRAGIATDAFSELTHVVKLSGGSQETLEKAFKSLAKSASYAHDGLKTYTREFDKLGISVSDNQGNLKGIEPLFMEVAAAVGDLTNETQRAASASNLFGRAGTQLIPMFQLGAEGIKHYREEARRLGVSIGPEAAQKAERLTDMMERLKAALKGLTMVVGEILAGGFDKLLVYLTNFVVHVREFIRNNPQFVAGLQKVALALTGIGAALVGIGTASRMLSVLVSPGGVLLALAGTLLYISGALDPLIDKWGKAVLGFEVGGKSISSWLALVGESFSILWKTFKESLASMVGLMKPFGKLFVQAFVSIWAHIKNGLLDLGDFIFAQLSKILYEIGRSLLELSEGTSSPIYAKEFAQFANAAFQAENKIGGMVSNRSQQKERRAGAEIERMLTAQYAKEFGTALGDELGNQGSIWDSALKRIAEKWGGALKPLAEAVFGAGGHTAAGEQGALSVWDQILNIGKGLGQPFKEFAKPAVRPAASVQLAYASSGTFSGAGAAFMGRQSPAVQIAKQQLDVLKEIRDNVAETGAAGYGGEE